MASISHTTPKSFGPPVLAALCKSTEWSSEHNRINPKPRQYIPTGRFAIPNNHVATCATQPTGGNMKRVLLAITAVTFLICIPGCPNISPFSPESRNRIGKVEGDIEGIETTQDSLVLELQRLRQENTILADKIENLQQAQGNFIDQNSGVKIGDGFIIGGVLVIALAMFLVYHYRMRALQHKEASEILAQQVALYNDEDLNDQIFMAAMNTKAESNIYHLMVKSQGQIASMARKP